LSSFLIIPAFALIVSTTESIGQSSAPEIDWATAQADFVDSTKDPAFSRFRAVLDTKEIDSIGLPVRVVEPGNDITRSKTDIDGQGLSYSASYEDDAVQVTVIGNANNPIADVITDGLGADGAPAILVETTDAGIVASSPKYNVDYSIEVLCRLPDDDRCINSNFIEGIAESLVVVGGSQIKGGVLP